MIYVYAGLAGIIAALSGIVWYQGHRVQRLQTEIAMMQQLARAQAEHAKEVEHAVEQHNESVLAEFQQRIADSDAHGRDLARRLFQALSRGSPVPPRTDQPQPVAAGPVATGPSTIEPALAAYDAACQRDAAQLNSLIAEIERQL